MKWSTFLMLSSLLSLQAIAKEPADKQNWQLQSPDQQISLRLSLSDQSLTYSVNYKNKAVIKPSALGFAFKDQPQLQANLKAQKV
ncbi:MAG: glycoside hydrolase family 97 N-terminal domain-containing protein, partial [Pararheinheimera sp.]|nr:glycoside hydrolase family 97 N-terminal domain-containing protein [Rheinheimera sp.]